MDDKNGNLISESMVKLIFDQLKDASELETKAIVSLTEAVTTLINAIGNFPSDVFDLLNQNKEVIRGNKDLLGNLHRDYLDLSKDLSDVTENCNKARIFYLDRKEDTDKVFETSLEKFTKILDVMVELLNKINNRYWKFMVIACVCAASSSTVLIILQFIIFSKKTIL